MYKVGDSGTVNGKKCKVVESHEEGPFKNVLYVSFQDNPSMPFAYVNKKDFARAVWESGSVCCPNCGNVYQKVVYRDPVHPEDDTFECTCGRVWKRYEGTAYELGVKNG